MPDGGYFVNYPSNIFCNMCIFVNDHFDIPQIWLGEIQSRGALTNCALAKIFRG